MGKEITVKGGNQKIRVQFEAVIDASRRCENVSRRYSALAQKLADHESVLHSPQGRHAHLAYTLGVVAFADDLTDEAMAHWRLACDYFELCLALWDAAQIYVSAEEYSLALLDARTLGEKMSDWWDRFLGDGPFDKPALVFEAISTAEMNINWNDRRSISARLAAGDGELSANGDLGVVLMSLAHNQDLFVEAFKFLFERYCWQIDLAMSIVDYLDGTKDWNDGSMATVSRAGLFLLTGLGLVNTKGLIIKERSDLPADMPAQSKPSELFRGIVELQGDSEGYMASVEIRKIRGPSGEEAWTVIIPGTEEMMNLTTWDNPSNGLSNLMLMGFGSSEMTVVVASAMRQAGIKPNDPVLLVGHSQGGMIAASLAGNKEFKDLYNVQGIATAGSPLGSSLEIPKDIAVLAYEHQTDWIPKLDGADNPVHDNMATVTRDHIYAESRQDVKVAYSYSDSHSLDAYIGTAELTEKRRTMEVTAWLDDMKLFLSEESQVVDVKRFSAERPD